MIDARDRAALSAHGLDLSPVAKIVDGLGYNHTMGVVAKPTWVLSWTDATRVGKQPTDNPADFVSGECERGVPLFEKTWMFFSRMIMEGRAEAAYVGKPKQ